MKFDDLSQFIKSIIDFKKESSRGVAILSCAYLDDLLNDILKTKLIYNKTLFDQNIDRLTFERRIALCYLMGLIDQKTKSDLKNINKIRNEFAHDKNLNIFDKKTKKVDIPSLLDNLHIIKYAKKKGSSFSNSRMKYESAVQYYIGFLYKILDDCERIKEKKSPI